MLTSSECLKRFGMPTATVQWETKVLTSWDVPSSINDIIHALPNRIYCNRLMTAPLEKAFRNLIQRGYAHELKTWDGCYNIRKKRGLNTLSIHSWGLAIDVNAAWNQLGKKPQLSREFANCFIEAGFEWGGDWQMPRTDGMHFQLKNI